MSKKIHFFNMIEVLLALAVIAIGMTSILGLFPVGLNASRDAIAQNCSADIADQMITYIRVMGESSDNAYNKTFDYDDMLNTDLPAYGDLNLTNDITIDIRDEATGTSTFNIKNQSDQFLEDYKNSDFSTNFTRVASGWAIFRPKIDGSTPTDLRRRVYFIVKGPNCTEDGAGNIDYSAMALVWKEPVQIRRYDGSDWTLWPPDISNLAIAYDYSAKINVELSWPLELPYAERKKRYYQVVINRP